MIVFDIPLWQVFTLLTGIVLPLAVGLVTTKVTNPGRKAILLAALAVVISLLTELGAALQHGEEYNLGMALLMGVGTFLVAVGTHYGLWKPTGVAEKAADVLHTTSQPPLQRQEVPPEVTNRTGRPEPLLTADQYASLDDGPRHRADE